MPRISKHTAVTPTTPTTPAAPRISVELVTAKEAAVYLGIGLPSLNAMRQAGTGPSFCRVSPRRVMYPIDGLKEYAAARTVNPTAA